MGTTIYENTTRREVIEDVLEQLEPELRNLKRDSGPHRILKHSMRGSRLWYLARAPHTNEKWIGLVLIDAVGAGAFSVKHLDETAGPMYYDCPLGWLDECTEPYNDYARQWREDVRMHAQAAADKRKLNRSFVAGQSVVYGGHTYTLLYKLVGRRGWSVREVHSGVEYRMKLKQLAASSLVEQSLAA